MATEHTPTPWQLRDEFEYGPALIVANVDYSADGTGIDCTTVVADMGGTQADAANAEFIVLAVNAHYAMVEALKGVIRVADRATVEFDAAKAALKLAGWKG